jgi:LAS superfamily LD-carboxypeptidase LdcB
VRLPKPAVILPKDLRRQPNGQLPPRLLTTLGSDLILHHKAAQAWQVLAELALTEGLRLWHVGDYRTLARQKALFFDRMKDYPDAKRDKQTTRRYEGKLWYLHKGAPVATPGTSNHGLGLAVDACVLVRKNNKDVRLPISHKPIRAKRNGLDFLRANAISLGWGWELDDEPWHIRYFAGDEGTVRLNRLLAGE